MRIVNKEFDQLVWRVIKTINFNKRGDIPKVIVLELLRRAKKVEKINFGKIMHLNQTDFLKEV